MEKKQKHCNTVSKYPKKQEQEETKKPKNRNNLKNKE